MSSTACCSRSTASWRWYSARMSSPGSTGRPSLRRVGKGALAPCPPPAFVSVNGGHASLCPPDGSLSCGGIPDSALLVRATISCRRSRQRRGACAERTLHHHGVEPAAELEADIVERAG